MDTAIKNQEINAMISQLGGNKFFVMTGSKPQYKDTKGDPMVAIKLVTNKSKANYMKLKYVRGLDTYTMEFIRMWGGKEPVILAEYERLHGEDLQSTFTGFTGLNTRL